MNNHSYTSSLSLSLNNMAREPDTIQSVLEALSRPLGEQRKLMWKCSPTLSIFAYWLSLTTQEYYSPLCRTKILKVSGTDSSQSYKRKLKPLKSAWSMLAYNFSGYCMVETSYNSSPRVQTCHLCSPLIIFDQAYVVGSYVSVAVIGPRA